MIHDEKTSVWESIFVVGITVLFMIGLFVGMHFVVEEVKQEIADRGGLKGIAISVGKTMKEIKKEINKEEEK